MNSIFYLRQLRILFLLFSFVLRSAEAESYEALMALQTARSPSPVPINQDKTLPPADCSQHVIDQSDALAETQIEKYRFQVIIDLEKFSKESQKSAWSAEHKTWISTLISDLHQIKDLMTAAGRPDNTARDKSAEASERQLGSSDMLNILQAEQNKVQESLDAAQVMPEYLMRYLVVLYNSVQIENNFLTDHCPKGCEVACKSSYAEKGVRSAKLAQQLTDSSLHDSDMMRWFDVGGNQRKYTKQFLVIALFDCAQAHNIKVRAKLMTDLLQMQEKGRRFENQRYKKSSAKACMSVPDEKSLDTDCVSVPELVSVKRYEVYDRLVEEQQQMREELIIQQAQQCLLVQQMNQALLLCQSMTIQQMQQAHVVAQSLAAQPQKVEQDLVAQQIQQAQKVWQALQEKPVQQTLTAQPVQQIQQVQQTLTAQQVQKMKKALEEQKVQQGLLVQKVAQVLEVLQEQKVHQEVIKKQAGLGAMVLMLQHTLMTQKDLTEQKAVMAQNALAQGADIARYLAILKKAITYEKSVSTLGASRRRTQPSCGSRKRERDPSAMPLVDDMPSAAQKKYDAVLTPEDARGWARQEKTLIKK
ncbi:MAG: hypothetical protein OXC30_06570 [Alphaproteobacteria bacterium]|nr:hypothetical protein [Alphaproteobacteria bacterium]